MTVKLIAEIILDPSTARDMIVSGEHIENIGIDFELDYPSLRVLRVFNENNFFYDDVKGFPCLPVVDEKISFVEGVGISETLWLETSSAEIWFETLSDERSRFVDIILYSKDKIFTSEEEMCFMNSFEGSPFTDINIIDVNGTLIQPLGIPVNEKIDPEIDFVALNIKYTKTSSQSPQFYLSNFYWRDYTKPLFVETLEDAAITVL